MKLNNFCNEVKFIVGIVASRRRRLGRYSNYYPRVRDFGGYIVNVGFYSWLNAYLRHLLSAAPSCWPDSAKPPTGKRGLKYGGAKRSSPVETMALAGILSKGYDNLKWRDRKFLSISDDYEGGVINLPELYAQLESSLPKWGTWNRLKYFRIKRKVNQRVKRLKKNT